MVQKSHNLLELAGNQWGLFLLVIILPQSAAL